MNAPPDPLVPHRNRDPNAIALVASEGAPCTFAAMWETHARRDEVISAWLDQGATVPRVLSLLPDEPSSALAVLSIAASTWIAPVNPTLSPVELEEYAARLEPAVALVRADRPDDCARVEALGLPSMTLTPRSGTHCADFDLVPPPDLPCVTRAPSQSGMILSTSGSTGTPKLVPLTYEQMRRSAGHISAWLRLGAGDRALHMLPMFHVGAFVDLMLAPLTVGGSVHFGHPIATERLVAAIAESQATWLQLVPTMLHHLLAQGDARLAEAASLLRFVRTVSADLAPALQERAHELFRNVPIIQMYGMTETAGQITSNPLPPEAARPGTVGLPAGPEVRVMDAHANPRPAGQVGEICVAGPTVMSGYLRQDDTDAFHGPWFRTGDLGYLDESGFLTLTGRRKEMINRGGEKIAPVEVERALLTHPDVLEVAAFGVGHPSLGEEVMAAVVAVPGRRVEVEAVVERARGQLADFKRPRRVVLLDKLPRLGSGKIDRMKLRAAGLLHDGSTNKTRKPLTSLGRVLSRIWAETLGTDPPHPDSDFFDEGGDSLAATTFVVRVEESLGVILPANLLFESPTFAQLEESISRLPRRQAPAEPLTQAVRRAIAGWAGVPAGPHELLVGRRTVGSMTPFFFIAAGLTETEDLVSAFHPERPVYMMRTLSRLRTRFGRSLKTDKNKRRLAALYRDGISAVQPDGPVLLGGFCQGADVARLVADALRAAGREVALLGIIDRVFKDPVPGRAAIVWTTGSVHSADTQFRDSERNLDLLYPDGCAVLHMPTDHGAALQGASAQRIAAFFEEEFAHTGMGASECQVAESSATLARRRQAHSARIRLASPRFGGPGERLCVRARVTNTSSMPWNASTDDGFALYARWLNLDGHQRTHLSAVTPLGCVVQPGETIRLELSVPFPEKRLPMILMADMVDDGLNWFHWVGSRPAYRLVWPKPVRLRIGSASSQR